MIFLSLSFFLVRSVQKPKNSHKSVSLLCHNSKGIYHPLIRKFNIQKVLQLHVLLVFFGPFQALHRLFRRENFCARYPNKNFTLIKKNGKHFMIYRISWLSYCCFIKSITRYSWLFILNALINRINILERRFKFAFPFQIKLSLIAFET